LGHLYPFFLKLKGGGKGVATATGCFLIISPLSCLISILFFIFAVFSFHRVSIGSLTMMTVLPLFVFLFSGSFILTAGSLILAIFVYFRHKENIKRLRSGTEPYITNRTK
jgi:glycerol-3-phosphate acyltransferase PlsY